MEPTTPTTPRWDDGTPVPPAPYNPATCAACLLETECFVVDEGAPADLENGPSILEIPTYVCAACFEKGPE